MESSNDDKLQERICAAAFQRRNIILHGPGGVGKSHRAARVAQALDDIGMCVFTTATTGVAAVGVSNSELKVVATTLHRFAGCGAIELGDRAPSISSIVRKVQSNFMSCQRWRKCQVLIIDEVSMMGAQFFKYLNAIAQTIRGNELPFGGIQLIVCGDFLQLPPVKDDWVFRTQEWQDMDFRPFILETPYRYDNINFFELLLRIRQGELSPEDYRILRKRVRANEKMQDILATLQDTDPAEIIKPTMFFSRRRDVDAFNDREIEKLEGESVLFTAKDSFIAVKGNPKFDDYKKLLDEDMPRELEFKVGAQVMLRVNLDTAAGYVNGSRGVVCEIIPGEAMIVKFLNGVKLRVDMYTRELEDKYAIATRTQMPFILAYAMTIHKSQGATLDYAVVNLGPSVFAAGQAYVALSRCTSVSGLFISELVAGSIIVSPIAAKYGESLVRKAAIEDAAE